MRLTANTVVEVADRIWHGRETIAAGKLALELDPADFGDDLDAPPRPTVSAVGAVSGEMYRAPVDALLAVECRERPVLHPAPSGVATDMSPRAALQAAAADLVRRDAAQRWWQSGNSRRGNSLLPADDLLAAALPGQVRRQVAGSGLRAHAFLLPHRWPVAFVLLHQGAGRQATLGSGIAPTARISSALRSAFFAAVSGRVAVTDVLAGRTRPTPSVVARLDIWFRGQECLAALLGRCRPVSAARDPERGGAPGTDWIDVAQRRLGHEPVFLRLTTADARSVVTVACPGSATHRPQVPVWARPFPAD